MTHNNTTQPILPPFIESNNIYTVAELNTAINVQLQQNFGTVYVEGEISNLVKPASGHYYFTLKDVDGQIKCALFKGFRTFIKTKIENGQKILVKAKISIYVPKGDYQLIVEHVYPTGLGALQQAFEELKRKLQAEGLFQESHKKSLPKLPKQIFIITSPTGAAIKDILTTLKRRFATIPVKIIPTIVQGNTAAASIAQALKTADKLGNHQTDLIILARGGGSLEDLWAFNDESLARTIFQLHTPVITGIGHEIDFTIADLVADLRAPTPTAAAEIASANWQEYINYLANIEQHLIKNFKFALLNLQQRLKSLQHTILQHHPRTKIFNQVQQVDELYLKLSYQWERNTTSLKAQLKILTHKLEQSNPINKIKLSQNNLKHARAMLLKSVLTLIQLNKNKLSNNVQSLNAMNPLEVLSRGYSIVRESTGAILTNSTQVQQGDKIEIKLYSGEIHARVD